MASMAVWGGADLAMAEWALGMSRAGSVSSLKDAHRPAGHHAPFTCPAPRPKDQPGRAPQVSRLPNLLEMLDC